MERIFKGRTYKLEYQKSKKRSDTAGIYYFPTYKILTKSGDLVFDTAKPSFTHPTISIDDICEIEELFNEGAE